MVMYLLSDMLLKVVHKTKSVAGKFGKALTTQNETLYTAFLHPLTPTFSIWIFATTVFPLRQLFLNHSIQNQNICPVSVIDMTNTKIVLLNKNEQEREILLNI